MDKDDYNPRMPLTPKGMLYAMSLTAAAIATAYPVIRMFGITDDDNQYAVTIGLIVFYIGTFFCRDSIRIGLPKRALWSFVFALISALLIVAIGLFFEYSFSV
jgi:hypothetical protein